MHNISIPRWLMIATAAFLAFAILVIVVHPYYNVSSATVVEQLLLAVVGAAIAGVVVVLPVAPRVVLARLPEPRPLPVVERNPIRRI